MPNRLGVSILIILSVLALVAGARAWLAERKLIAGEERQHQHDLASAAICDELRTQWDGSRPDLERSQRKFCASVEMSIARYRSRHPVRPAQ